MTLPAHSHPAWPPLLATPHLYPSGKSPPTSKHQPDPRLFPQPSVSSAPQTSAHRFASPWPLVWSANTHAFRSIIHSLSSMKHSSDQNTQVSRHDLLRFTLVHRPQTQHLTSLPSPKSQWAHTGRPGHHPILLHGPQASSPQGPPQTAEQAPREQQALTCSESQCLPLTTGAFSSPSLPLS